MTAALPFDGACPPIESPVGCVDRLMWQLARRLFADHQPGVDGFCVVCRPVQFYPCAGRDLADFGLVAAFDRSAGSRSRLVAPSRNGG